MATIPTGWGMANPLVDATELIKGNPQFWAFQIIATIAVIVFFYWLFLYKRGK